MRICLNMIVRDEAAVIERCLTSVKPHIHSWVIVDTGSTDDTPQRIERALAGVPGQLHHRPWHNFGHNRNEALQLARGQGDYLLFIDADEQLGVAPGVRWPALQEGAYSLEARFAELSYDRVSLVSTRLPWVWKGVLHEYLDAGEPVAQPRLPGFWIEVTPDGARSGDPRKFEKDITVLEAALREEPDNARYVFYLAQSCRDAGQLDKARQHYLQRADMGGWDEEAWYSRYQAACLSERLGHATAQVTVAYLQAYQTRPTRIEPLVALAVHHRLRSDWALSYLYARAAHETPLPTDRLFVDMPAWQWRAADERAIAAFYTGRMSEAGRLWQQLLGQTKLPAAERARIENNRQYLL